VAALAEILEGLTRRAILSAADSLRLQHLAYRFGMNVGARRFVAGETLEEFLGVARRLNARGFLVAAGMLGEGVQAERDAAGVVHDYCHLARRIAAEGLRASIALKLTHLGLAIRAGLALDNVRAIVREAERLGLFVRIDMEQSAYTDATLEIYRRLLSEGMTNVGTVLQAYLYRSRADLAALAPLRPNLRLVKGAYLEPPDIAFPKKADVDRNLVALIEQSLAAGGFTAIATHDRRIIEQTIDLVARTGTPPERWEFQMLYGVRPALQDELRARGFAVRLAVPFGSQWYPYLMRRLAERPANLFFFAGALWRR
jgi:proline dehydrogenase